MKRIETFNEDVIRFRQPAGIGTFIGLIFFLAVLALPIFYGFRVSHSARHPDSALLIAGGIVLPVLWGWFFRYVGDFMRIAVTIDRRARTVTCGRGFIVPFSGRPVSLDAFNKLVIGWILIKRARYSEHFYILCLAMPDGSLVRIGKCSNYQPIRNMAEEIGQFIQLGVLDAHRTSRFPAGRDARSLAD
jgi:hypothetical protein